MTAVFDEAVVQAEYERLGYGMGWAFAMTPVRHLRTAEVVLIGLNPGGREGGPAWEFEEGNAYLDEVWTADGSPTAIQTEVRELLALLGVQDSQVFAGQFIPFRSPSLPELARYAEALAFARRLWTWVLAQTPARLFVCMGQDAAWHIAELLGARGDGEYSSGWGTTVVHRHLAPDGRVVVALPHPSRYRLLSPGRDPAERRAAKLAILQAARSPERLGPEAVSAS